MLYEDRDADATDPQATIRAKSASTSYGAAPLRGPRFGRISDLCFAPRAATTNTDGENNRGRQT
jgi:hypothetical protein